MTRIDSNGAERRRWNDRAWASAWSRRELLTMAVADVLVGRAGLRPGDRVLDIGTGGGVAAFAAGLIVGEGIVVGADISEPMVEMARDRAEQRAAGNVSFVVADVQHQTVPGGPFDVAISQFGVMFFDEPQVAFANIRRQLVSGGRLRFACWRAAELNPWFPGSALAGIVPPPPPPAPGKSPTGPFSLCDADRTMGILEASGWREVASAAHDLVVTVERDVIVDDEALRMFGVAQDAMAAAWEAIEGRLAPITRDDGRIDVPLAFQVFTAAA